MCTIFRLAKPAFFRYKVVPEEGGFGQPKYSTHKKDPSTLCRLLLKRNCLVLGTGRQIRPDKIEDIKRDKGSQKKDPNEISSNGCYNKEIVM